MIVIEVRNCGRTPAEITDVFVDLGFDALPRAGSYVLPPSHEQTRHFLVTEGVFEHRVGFQGLNSDVLSAVKGGTKKLWVYGYVDYRDSLRRRHRGGYMRRFDPGIILLPGNNLVIDSTPGFNYDRLRAPDEGFDWNEE